jgi:hypothetical protein
MKKTKDEIMDAFYLLGRYRALCSIMLNVNDVNYDIHKQMVDDLKNEVDMLCKGEEITK